ncbi:sucrase ferredoxin [Devosia sp. FKR38]|uniref:sucrase ferredoxin n=1 Tax=Devosia sp. FKR38 TaxID=2562312 RepID=UPI0010C0EC52|nr:sucrase ferredoxin [Devosia sp. FKR38]
MAQFCTDIARACGEPLAGTGALAERHLFLRWPKGKWRRPRYEAADLEPAVRAAMIDAIAHDNYVGLFANDGPELELVSFPDGVRILPRDAAHAAELIADWGRGTPLPGTPVGRRIILCCTDAKTDACCARYGFGIYKTLAEQAPALGLDVLQVTHIGGCHFAPSVIVMPERRRYGRLTTEMVPAFLAAIAGDRLYLPAYKGDPGLGEMEQAADIAARQWLGDVDRLADTSRIASVAFGGPGKAEVLVDCNGIMVSVRLTSKVFAVHGSCRSLDAAPAPKTRWEAVGVQLAGAVTGQSCA